MIVALLNNKSEHDWLIKKLDQQPLPVLIFTTVLDLQRSLELHAEPTGIIVDFTTPAFHDFLIRFSLRYPEIPVFSIGPDADEIRQQEVAIGSFFEQLSATVKSEFKGRILLVDDSKTVQIRYRKILEADGFEVDLADDAEQGLSKALVGNYDLAIIDYFMPGDNGAQLCRNLQSHDASYELVTAILTAQYQQSLVDECLRAGARDCMFKNESPDLFLTRVRALIRGVERKRQVEKERNRLIGLLYSVAEGVYGVSAEGKIQFVNPATLKLLGQSMVDLIGRSPHDGIHPIDNIGQETSMEHCFLQQAYLLGDELREWRTLFQRADGSLFPVECSVTLLGDAENNQGSVVVFRDISEQMRLEKNWQWQLSHDHLTGLLNRNAFEDILLREHNRVRRTNDDALLLFIDLDNFKLINDELGHAAGDKLLVNLSKNLSSRARDTDNIGRLGGDEFVVLLTGVSKDNLEELAEKYRRLLEETSLHWEGKNHTVTGSIGVVSVDKSADSIGELLARADQACQQAKIKGRNQWAIYSPTAEFPTEQGNWFKRLNTAMKNKQFVLLQQPVFDASEQTRQVGANCLLRLQEGNNLISPAVFMSNARRFGVIKNIDRLALRQLMEFCKKHKLNETAWFSLSLSIESFSDDSFRAEIVKLWRQSGLKPRQLRLEVAEEDLFNFPDWQFHLSKLREQGFGVIMSRFGMNAQSILVLPQLPIDAIKLDSSLTRELATSLPRTYFVDAIVRTANEGNIDVIATHIESSQDLETVIRRGVMQVQGFHLGRPVQLRSSLVRDSQKLTNEFN